MGAGMLYRIKVKGELDQTWSDWLGGPMIARELAQDGSVITVLTATDQPTLFGILDSIRDLNLILIAVISGEDKIELSE
jgi:hypothetical protein